MTTFENVIQAPFYNYDQPDHAFRGNWSCDFFKNGRPVILELGCGKGEYSVSLAKRFPEKNFIGIDIKGARMWKGAKDALEWKISNVGFLRTSIEIVEKFFGPGEIEQIWLTFPDPQMKNSRRRLTSSFFMEKYRRILSQDGMIHLKTDSNFQFRYTLEMAKENKLNILACTDDLYSTELADDVLSIRTFYENQWLERGISIKYLAFQLTGNEPLREPVVEIEKDPYRSFGRLARE
jgi:tRNA (guanine-N7-)-methyltransferase